jgi:hypothetical protein
MVPKHSTCPGLYRIRLKMPGVRPIGPNGHTIFTPLREFHAVFFSTLEYGVVHASICK